MLNFSKFLTVEVLVAEISLAILKKLVETDINSLELTIEKQIASL